MKLRRYASALTLVVGLYVPAQLNAQAVYGNVVGTVTDPSGAPVPNAKITIRDMDRDVSNVTNTNESGNYSQRFLIVGRYQIRAEAAGFQTSVQDNVAVSVDAETKV